MKKYTETWNYDLNKMPKIGEKIIIDFGNGVGTNRKYPYLVEEITKSKRGDFVVYKVEGRQLISDTRFRNKWFELFFKGVTMVQLNSVGSILDTKTGMVYPQNNDGTPDLYCATYLPECSNEWFDSLDDQDKKVTSSLALIRYTNKCKCCDKTSEYHINKKVYYESGEYGRHYNWCELSEYFGDDWFHIGEEYIDIKHDGYYCKKHFEESVNTSPFNIK